MKRFFKRGSGVADDEGLLEASVSGTSVRVELAGAYP